MIRTLFNPLAEYQNHRRLSTVDCTYIFFSFFMDFALSTTPIEQKHIYIYIHTHTLRQLPAGNTAQCITQSHLCHFISCTTLKYTARGSKMPKQSQWHGAITLALECQVGHHRACLATTSTGDRYVLGFAPSPRFLQSPTLCRGYKKSFG